jgi:hypothetical protein
MKIAHSDSTVSIASVNFEREAGGVLETLSLFGLLPLVFINGTISVILRHKDPRVPCAETKDGDGPNFELDDPGQKDSH